MNTPRTPRDLLLARHTSAQPALDAQHTALLTRFAATSTHATAVPSPLAAFRVVISSLHRELFVPYRRTWTTLAAAWIAILAFQQLDRLATSPFSTGRLATTTSSPEAPLFALWLEQRRQLAALAADPAIRPAPTRETLPPPAPPRPLGCIAPARLVIA